MEKQTKTILEEIRGTAEEILAQVKKLIREGNARRVIVKGKNGSTLFQSRLTIGAAGFTFFMVYAPVITAITTLLLMANDVTVLIEREVDEDEYEVSAEVIEIEDEGDDNNNGNNTDTAGNSSSRES